MMVDCVMLWVAYLPEIVCNLVSFYFTGHIRFLLHYIFFKSLLISI